jgi:GNAT superfamily N-acetyltransferase
VKLRAAQTGDVPQILGFIRELAVYEREPDAVKMTEAQLAEALFGKPAKAEALLAETEAGAVGFAIWFESFNTWTGRPSLYLEDLYVRPEARKHGIGKAIFAHLAKLAMARGYHRFEWSVLDWNEPAIRFYVGLGAQAQSDWTKYRLSGDAWAAAATL